MADVYEQIRSVHFNDVLSETRPYTNVSNIVEKMERDGNIKLLSSSFDGIIRREIVFAVCGSIIRAQKNEGEDLFDGPAPPASQELTHLQRKPEADINFFEFA